MIIAIVVGVVSLLVLVLAFFASKVWHWAHVLVLVLFYFVSVGYAVLAARSLDRRLEYQKQIATAEEQIDQTETLNDALLRGAPASDGGVINRLASRDVLVAEEAANENEDMPGVVTLEHRLRLQNRVRGRVWRYVRPGEVDPQTGMVNVLFGPPPQAQPAEGEPPAEDAGDEPAPLPPLSLSPDSIVYVFEQGPAGELGEDGPDRAYLGEFRVEQVQGRQATLEPLDQLELDAPAQERLLQSEGPWIVYQTMPADDRDLFAGFDEETLRRLLPEGSVQEYLRDKTPTTPDDPLDRREPLDADGNVLPPDTPESEIASTRYRRRLRDYTLLLNDYERERAGLVARQQALEADIAKLNESLEDARRIEGYRQQELADWQADLDAVVRDRQAIEAHVEALRRQIANARQLLAATLEENAQLASARAERRGPLVPIGPGALDVDAL